MIRREVSQHPRPSVVETLVAARDLHDRECGDCRGGARCAIGERLASAVDMATAVEIPAAESA
ncbi:hypothetical protein D7319_27760 [Streptomyces radicis]|uniref:Uncharacterized protein n=1 Tax=Streptomyces radicis TaxID=1750517 RepID=A0A3A9VUC3_9ACTN|nr:hypothetical protein D7319_27760 [Streptomyces radicis]RKN15562.1 hypothetical protein D7318_27165 [Streptomyces radicis]